MVFLVTLSPVLRAERQNGGRRPSFWEQVRFKANVCKSGFGIFLLTMAVELDTYFFGKILV